MTRRVCCTVEALPDVDNVTGIPGAVIHMGTRTLLEDVLTGTCSGRSHL